MSDQQQPQGAASEDPQLAGQPASNGSTLEARITDLEAKVQQLEPIANAIIGALAPGAAPVASEIEKLLAGIFTVGNELAPLHEAAQNETSGGQGVGTIIAAAGRQLLGLFHASSADVPKQR